MKINAFVFYTFLKPNISRDDIENLWLQIFNETLSQSKMNSLFIENQISSEKINFKYFEFFVIKELESRGILRPISKNDRHIKYFHK